MNAGQELGRSIHALADDLERVLETVRQDFPADREWAEAEVLGLQFRIAVLSDRAVALVPHGTHRSTPEQPGARLAG